MSFSRYPPRGFYLSGFLAPLNAPAAQKADDDEQGELELATAGAGADEDDSTAEAPVGLRVIEPRPQETFGKIVPLTSTLPQGKSVAVLPAHCGRQGRIVIRFMGSRRGA